MHGPPSHPTSHERSTSSKDVGETWLRVCCCSGVLASSSLLCILIPTSTQCFEAPKSQNKVLQIEYCTPPNIRMLKPEAPVSWDLRTGCRPHDGIGALMRGDVKELAFFTPNPPHDGRMKQPPISHEESLHQEPDDAGALILDCPASGTLRNECRLSRQSMEVLS